MKCLINTNKLINKHYCNGLCGMNGFVCICWSINAEKCMCDAEAMCLCFLRTCCSGLSVVLTYWAVCLDLGWATKLSHHQFKVSLRLLKWGRSCPDINNLREWHGDFGNKWCIDKHVSRVVVNANCVAFVSAIVSAGVSWGKQEIQLLKIR